MKRAYFPNKRDLISWTIGYGGSFTMLLILFGFSVAKLYSEINVEIQEIDLSMNTVIFMEIAFLSVSIMSFAKVLYEWGILLAKYELSEDGITIEAWFKKIYIPWSDFKVWIVTNERVLSKRTVEHCIIGIMTVEMPKAIFTDRVGPKLLTVRGWITLKKEKMALVGITYSDERYEEFKKYFEKYGVQQITKDGIGRLKYGAVK